MFQTLNAAGREQSPCPRGRNIPVEETIALNNTILDNNEVCEEK